MLLQSRKQDSESEAWGSVLDFSICVIPTKLGEASYQKMAGDLQTLSRSLLVDAIDNVSRN